MPDASNKTTISAEEFLFEQRNEGIKKVFDPIDYMNKLKSGQLRRLNPIHNDVFIKVSDQLNSDQIHANQLMSRLLVLLK